jgi:hypothetical protein
MPRVLCQRIKQRQAPPVAILFLDGFEAAQLDERYPARLDWGQPRANVIVHVELQVSFELVAQLAFSFASAKRLEKANQECAYASHAFSPPGVRNVARMAVT